MRGRWGWPAGVISRTTAAAGADPALRARRRVPAMAREGGRPVGATKWKIAGRNGSASRAMGRGATQRFLHLRGSGSFAGGTGAAGSFAFVPATHPCLHPGRCARVFRGVCLGCSERCIRNGARARLTSARSVRTRFRLRAGRRTARVPEVSRFPPVRRDLAILVDEEVPFGAIRERNLRCVGSVERPGVFDIYRGLA